MTHSSDTNIDKCNRVGGSCRSCGTITYIFFFFFLFILNKSYILQLKRLVQHKRFAMIRFVVLFEWMFWCNMTRIVSQASCCLRFPFFGVFHKWMKKKFYNDNRVSERSRVSNVQCAKRFNRPAHIPFNINSKQWNCTQ